MDVRTDATEDTSLEAVATAAAVSNDAETEVAALLDSWHSAAERLEESHRAKCDEVRRLREELAAKNAELAQRHRLSDFGATVARVAQEMQGRVESVQHHLDLLRRRVVNDLSGRELIDKVVTDLAAWETALADLLGFAADGPPSADVLSIRDLVDGARTALSHQLAHRAVHVVVDVPEDARARGDQQLLQRAVINVVLQALDRVPAGGELIVAAADGDEAVELEVACGATPGETVDDDGKAVTPARKIDPGAMILRWAVVHHILHQHGGQALTKGDDQSGLSYVLRIPHRAGR